MPRKTSTNSEAPTSRRTSSAKNQIADTEDHRSAIDVAGLLKALEGHVLREASLSTTQEIALAAVMGVVNLILRFVTTDPIEILSAPSSST